MRRTFAVLCCLALLAPAAAVAQSNKKTTPAPEDVPVPVAGDLGLAGATCPDIARFLNVRTASAPSPSADGARVAFRTNTTGTPQVWVADARGQSAPYQITFGESVTFHEWSPGGDWIAYGVDRSGNEREGFYMVSSDGTREVELLAPSEAFRSWGGFSRDGSRVAYAATDAGGNDFHTYVINLTASPLRPFRVYAGQGGVYPASWRPDGGALILSRTRGEDANDVLYLDLHGDKVETLFQPQVAARYTSFSWTPDGRGFYLSTDQDRDFAGLAFFDITKRQLSWIETPPRDVGFVSLSHDGRYLAWTENAGGFSELRVRDLQTKRTETVTPHVARRKVEPLIVRNREEREREGRRAERGRRGAEREREREEEERGKTEPEIVSAPVRGVVGSLEWAATRPRLAIQISGPDVPGDIWVYDPTRSPIARASAAGARRQVGASRTMRGNAGQVASGAGSNLVRVTESSLAGLDPRRFVAPEAVSFPSHDGETIHGLLYLPRDAAPDARAPVVLSVHGGPTSQARPSFNSIHQYLLARGYAILDLNFRGSTGYGKRFARLDNGRLRPNAVKDMGAAVDWLARSGRPVNAARVAVMGGSYGGYMTFAALSQLPDKFAAGVSFVGVSNWVTALEGASPELKASDRVEYGNIDDPADREFFRELSPLTHVKNVRAPLLVSHGANDPRDPVTEADQIVRAIRERGGDVEYLRWPDEGHSIRKLSNRIIAYRRVARFLERTLGKGAVNCAAEASPASSSVRSPATPDE